MCGGLGIFWSLAWIFFVSDDPQHHKYITSREIEYIVNHRKIEIGNSIGKEKPPYLKILMNRSVWALAFCDFASAFGLYMVIIEGPSFMSNILNKNILEVGI